MIDVFFLSETTGVFDRKTRIAFWIGGDVDVTELAANEVPSILHFVTQRSLETPERGTLNLRSRPNIVRQAFEGRWIYDWIANDFQTRPRKYRKEWKLFFQASWGRDVDVHFGDLTKEVEHDLERALGKRAEPTRHAPGDPFEDPWASR